MGMMKTKDIVLMAGAVAAALQAVSSKITDPKLSMLFTFLGVGLAFLASAPRDPSSHDRSTDEKEVHVAENEGMPSVQIDKVD